METRLISVRGGELRSLRCLLPLLITLTAASCDRGRPSTGNNSGDSGVDVRGAYRIGAVLPLTGPSARYGNWIREGLELARSEINRQGGINGDSLQIIYEDDQANPTQAVNAMRKLVEVDRVPVVFGSWASSSVLAQAPIAERTRTILMAEALSPRIRTAGDYVFRIQPDARLYLERLVPYVRDELALKKVAIVYVNNDFGVDQAEVFRQLFTAGGGTVVASEAFDQGALDLRTQLAKVTAANPDALFVPAYTEIGNLLRQARELGMDQRVIASVPFENADILTAAGGAAEGVVYPHHFDPDAGDPPTQAYQRAYAARYGRPSEGFAALAYDGLHALAGGLSRCRRDTTCIGQYLYRVQVQGVTGPTRFDSNGDVVKPILIKNVRGGQFVTVAPRP